LLVVGEREMETQTVSVRARRGEDLGSMDLGQFISHITDDVERRGRVVLEN
jgi:threonyl-tRNA synthetase